MEELEKLCLRERQLLEGKWKTHSLPARRKASSSNDNTANHQASYSYSRPALSSEDIVNKPHPEQPTLMLAYQYLDPHYRTYVLSPQVTNGGEEYRVNLCTQRSCRPVDPHHFVIKTPCENSVCSKQSSPQSNGLKSQQNSIKRYEKKENHSNSSRHHLCNPCIKTNSNQDSTSLDAYDLASPCCDPHCVPSARRRSRNQKAKREVEEEEKKTSYQPTRCERKHKQHGGACHPSQNVTSKHRYFNLGAEIVSQCSLHSCTSSEFSNTQVAEVIESSGASYTTSLSTDTLYWDPPSGSFTTSRHGASSKSMAKSYHQNPQPYYPSENNDPQYTQYVKPKSWDNLTTKAFGGYGFGYGFLDTSAKQHKRSQTTKVNPSNNVQYVKHNERHLEQPIYSDRTFRRYVQPTKSTESLLTMPKFQTDSSTSCECLGVTTPTSSAGCQSHFFMDNMPSPMEPRECYYTRRTSRIDSNDIIIVSTSSEVTRL